MHWLTPALLLLADVAAVVAAALAAVTLRENVLPYLFGLPPFSPVRTYFTLWPVLLLFILIRAVYDLYPGYGLNAAEELRRQTQSTFLLMAFLLAGSALFQFVADYSRAVLITTGFFLLFLLPLVRAGLKALLARTAFYGESLWIIGCSARAEELKAILKRRPELGLKVMGQSAGLPQVEIAARDCLFVPDNLSNGLLPALLDRLNERFQRIWLVPDLLEVASVWVTSRDLQGHIALEFRNNLLDLRNRALKRSLDIALVLLSAPLVLPLSLLLALWIRLDSPGAVLFGQRRIGRDGKPFTAWKFRTMRPDADEQLERHLASCPEARAEWQATRKLRADPRVTRSGGFLRRFSLDELPQLWNVLRGEMSLVGPRPVMIDELAWYGDKTHLYTRVRPGITGLWQVSGRNDLSYAERIHCDAYYVRNWSIWLDFVIMSQTAYAVFSARGAY